MQHSHEAVDTGSFFGNLFQVYVPRSECMFHEKWLIALHITSDVLIAFSYYSIPIALICLANRRKDIAYNWMILLFAGFIILCGTTHIFNILAIWYPFYRLDGIVKFLTAVASIATAILLWRLMPHALGLPSLTEIKQRSDELEQLVDQRTMELTAANQALRESEEKFKTSAQNAEEASKAKSQFLANMSHELRTPMNAVVGLSTILAMNKTLPAKESEMVKTLQLSAQSLMGLINDLLDISKIEHKSVQLELIPFTLGDVINEVFSVLSVKSDEKNIKLNYANSHMDEKIFLGDPLRIRQILVNLVSNAIKFTETGGVTIGITSLEEKEKPDFIQIVVEDTGIGIPQEKLATIFDQFIQADTSITRKYGGTGLGLSISKNLAEMMGGEIIVESEYGKGSKFILTLPLKESSAVTSKPVPLKKDDGQPKVNKQQCILLVEDYKANILVAKSLLENMGYSVDVAVSGKEAVQKVSENRDKYFAVFMDIQMPEMDGLEATYFIREEETSKSLKRLPIIAMTANALLGDKEKCLNAGMDDYISKPFYPDELELALNRLGND